MPRQKDYLPLSPLLPLTPDWQALAVECSQAYYAMHRIEQALKCTDPAFCSVDGQMYWQAFRRVQNAASAISSWASEPDLYGRLLAKQAIEREMLDKLPALKAAICSNIMDNTPRLDCCAQCRYELGV